MATWIKSKCTCLGDGRVAKLSVTELKYFVNIVFNC